MEKKIEQIEKDIKEIKENDLFHIYARLGRVEGKLYVVVALGIATFIAVWIQ